MTKYFSIIGRRKDSLTGETWTYIHEDLVGSTMQEAVRNGYILFAITLENDK